MHCASFAFLKVEIVRNELVAQFVAQHGEYQRLKAADDLEAAVRVKAELNGIATQLKSTWPDLLARAGGIRVRSPSRSRSPARAPLPAAPDVGAARHVADVGGAARGPLDLCQLTSFDLQQRFPGQASHFKFVGVVVYKDEGAFFLLSKHFVFGCSGVLSWSWQGMKCSIGEMQALRP